MILSIVEENSMNEALIRDIAQLEAYKEFNDDTSEYDEVKAEILEGYNISEAEYKEIAESL
jgi:hypothetical protein